MIGVIGCGNMAQAIVRGYYQKDNKVEFLTYTPSFHRANELAKAVNGKAVRDLADLNLANTIVIGCKPQQLNNLVEAINKEGLDLSSKHIISILAATPIEIIKSKLNVSQVSRVMPNTPALIGKGISLIIHSNEVSESGKELVNNFFKSCGEVVEMPSEHIFDKVTTVSGSGPAYVFLFAQTMVQKLIEWDVEYNDAKKIVVQLFRGSSELMKDQDDNKLEDLIDKVTSKGGVTIGAVNSYKENKLDILTSKALDAAFVRSEEIKNSLVKS